MADAGKARRHFPCPAFAPRRARREAIAQKPPIARVRSSGHKNLVQFVSKPVLRTDGSANLIPFAFAERWRPPPRDWSRTADERKIQCGGGPAEPRRRETRYWREGSVPYVRRC